MMALLFSCYFMLIAAKHLHYVNGWKTKLDNEFDMKDLGAARRFLGWKFTVK